MQPGGLEAASDVALELLALLTDVVFIQIISGILPVTVRKFQ